MEFEGRVDGEGPADGAVHGGAAVGVADAAPGGQAAPDGVPGGPVADLAPLVRRVVGARLRDPHTVEDVVQETLSRVLAVQGRLEGSALAPYAVVTARNLVASLWEREATRERNVHRLHDPRPAEEADERLLRAEERAAVAAALERLSDRDRLALLGHEVQGRDTAALARQWGSTPRAVAAQLHRARARLRVEYLLELSASDPPTGRCRPVLLALSAGDRRRQGELDAGQHLLGCDFCAEVSGPLLERLDDGDTATTVRVPVRVDADVVTARQRGRELAAQAGLSSTDLTLVATAISEVARNIVKFADRGEVVVALVEESGRPGIRVHARDAGPGIADVGAALKDGFSTYGGLGLGLPGCRRLMDEFEIVSSPGEGTAVTMTKWGRPA